MIYPLIFALVVVMLFLFGDGQTIAAIQSDPVTVVKCLGILIVGCAVGVVVLFAAYLGGIVGRCEKHGIDYMAERRKK